MFKPLLSRVLLGLIGMLCSRASAAQPNVVFTADHGMAIGRHGLQGNIYLLGILATLCDVAGIQPPTTNEGIGFKPVLHGRQSNWKLIRHDSKSARNLVVEKLLENTPVPQFQLFDLAKDPYETTDVLTKHPDVSDQLKTRLAKMIADGRARPAGAK